MFSLIKSGAVGIGGRTERGGGGEGEGSDWVRVEEGREKEGEKGLFGSGHS